MEHPRSLRGRITEESLGARKCPAIGIDGTVLLVNDEHVFRSLPEQADHIVVIVVIILVAIPTGEFIHVIVIPN